ncbi:MAG: DUF1259 domain-containing protein [Pseudonocardiaceae bacterium]
MPERTSTPRTLRAAAVTFTLGALLASCSAATAPSAPARAGSPVDWSAVGRAMGSPLKTEDGDVHTAEFLRTDLHVVNAGVTENPGMELGAEAMFHQTTPGAAVLIGEVTVTGQELNNVLTRLEGDHTVQVTAIHKHLQDETPRLWWVHYVGHPCRWIPPPWTPPPTHHAGETCPLVRKRALLRRVC